MEPTVKTQYLLYKKYKLAFVHIAKAGASSILEMIIRDEYPNLVPVLNSKNKIFDMWEAVTNHENEEPKTNIPVSETVPDDFKIYACVRNPFTRIFSSYQLITSQKDKSHHIRPGETFKQFVMHSLNFFERTNRHFRSLQHLLQDVPKRTIPFRFEEYEKSMSSILKEAGCPHSVLHIHNNPGKLDYRKHYFFWLKTKVAALYKWDLDTFQYRFEESRYGKLPDTLQLIDHIPGS